MFDPEKVERFQRALGVDSLNMPRVDVVKASDYDQLLELYRAAAGPKAVNALMGKRLLASGWQRLGANDAETP